MSEPGCLVQISFQLLHTFLGFLFNFLNFLKRVWKIPLLLLWILFSVVYASTLAVYVMVCSAFLHLRLSSSPMHFKVQKGNTNWRRRAPGFPVTDAAKLASKSRWPPTAPRCISMKTSVGWNRALNFWRLSSLDIAVPSFPSLQLSWWLLFLSFSLFFTL